MARGRGWVYATVRSNGRPDEVEVRRRDGRYRTEVALEVGRNEITAKARVSRRGRKPKTTSSTIVVTRTPVPGDETGVLDLATSFWVAESSSEVYWLCGEGECGTRTRCFSVEPNRVDCPTASRSWPERVWDCGVVITVYLRGEQLYFGSYRCGGPMGPDPRRFVRPDIWREGRRFTVNAKAYPWLRWEINDPTRYGVPRFDVERDVFIP